MNEIDKIISRSFSDNEIVLNYSDAMELLHLFKQSKIMVFGWEGWVLYPSGELGHSLQHQGTVDLSELHYEQAIAETINTIKIAQLAWSKKPEIEGGKLIFNITAET